MRYHVRTFKEPCTRDNLTRDELFAICQALERGCELKQRNDAASFAVTQHPNREDPQLEQRATGRTVPGDIAVRLTRDAASRTYYNTVINTLTESAEFAITLAENPYDGLVSFLCVAHRIKFEKHGSDVAKVGGQFVPLVVSTSGVWRPDFNATSRAVHIRFGTPRPVRNRSLKVLIG